MAEPVTTPDPGYIFVQLGPNSDVLRLPADQAEVAGSLGYVPATDAAIQAYDLKNKYGTDAQAGIAGLEAAAKAATFGGSTYLERLGGVTPEAIKAREEQNPLAAGIGTATGIVAPLLLSGGLSGAAKGAVAAGQIADEGLTAAQIGRTILGGAPRQISRLGEAVGSLVPEGAEALGIPALSSGLGKIGVGALRAGVGSGIEGLAYGAANQVSEAALGDDKFNANALVSQGSLEHILESGKDFALLGGGLGILGGAAKAGAPKVAGWLEKAEDAGYRKSLGLDKADVPKGLINQAADLRLNDGRRVVGPYTSPEAATERAQQFIRETERKSVDSIDQAWADVQHHNWNFADAPDIRDYGRKAVGDIFDDVTNITLREPTRTSRARLEAAGLEALGLVDRLAEPVENPFAPGRVAEPVAYIPSDLLPLRRMLAGIPEARGAVAKIDDTIKNSLSYLGRVIDGPENAGQIAERIERLYNGVQAREAQRQTAEQLSNLTSRVEAASKPGFDPLSGWEVAGGLHSGPVGFATALAGRYAKSKLLTPGLGATVAGETANALRGFPPSTVEAALGQETLHANPIEFAGASNEDVDTYMARLAAQREHGLAQNAILSNPALQSAARDTVAGNQTKRDQDAAAPAVRIPEERVDVLSKIERAQKAVTKGLTDAAKAFVEGDLPKVALSATIGTGSEMQAIQNRIAQLANDPAKMVGVVTRQNQHIDEHAPKIAASVSGLTGTAISYLAAQIPPSSPATPFSPATEPSQSQKDAFHSKYMAVTRPIETLNRRNIDAEALDALDAVHAPLMDYYRRELVAALADATGLINYQQQLELSKRLGESLTPTLDPHIILSNQQLYVQRAARQAGPKGAAAINLASRTNPNHPASLDV